MAPRDVRLRASLTILLLLVLLSPDGSFPAPGPAVQPAGEPEIESLKEANRVLEEEIRLASRPQVYLVLDLAEGLIHFKSRGVELHQLPIVAWRVAGAEALTGVHHLRARPEVSRPKASPDPALEPISLEDMPGEYALQFDTGLLLTVAPPFGEQPWLWLWSRLREWWIRATAWLADLTGSSRPSLGAVVRVTLSKDAARSLAWSVTDDMPVLFNRAAR
jgi:hypothetical protein